MAEQPLRSLKTLQEQYSVITRKLQNIENTLKKILDSSGISIDVFNSANDYLDQFNQLNAEFAQKWQTIIQANRHVQTGNDFEDLDNKISELFDYVAELNREATSQNFVSSKLRSLFAVDTTEFKNALKYHKRQSIIHLVLLLVVTITAVCMIYKLFGFHNSLFTSEIKELLQTENTYKATLIMILIQLGGKLTLIFAFGWLIQFLGGLHSKHSQQAVIYQDRLAGLTTAELIITAGRTSTREQILKEMANTYLSDKENAFKPKEKPKTEEPTTKKDLLTFLKATIESLKSKNAT
jgi:hypothetical protein